MENTKIISILGLERGDFPYFLSRVFEEKKYRVLVIDNSCNHDVFLSLKREDENLDYVERGRTVFMRNKCATKEECAAFAKFDVVIIFHGLNVDYEMLDMSDKVLLQTDFIPSNTRYIKDLVDMEYLEEMDKENLYILYRDKSSSKLAEQYLVREFGLSKVENEITIYYDEGNYNAYLNFCYNGTQELRGISSEMKSALNTVKNALIGEDKNTGKGKSK